MNDTLYQLARDILAMGWQKPALEDSVSQQATAFIFDIVNRQPLHCVTKSTLHLEDDLLTNFIRQHKSHPAWVPHNDLLQRYRFAVCIYEYYHHLSNTIEEEAKLYAAVLIYLRAREEHITLTYAARLNELKAHSPGNIFP